MLVKLVFPSWRSPDSKEVCRFDDKNNPKCCTLSGLLSKVYEITHLKKPVQFDFYVQKKGNFIKLTTNTMLEQEFRNQSMSKCIRIYAVPDAESYQKPLNSFFNYCRPDELPNIIAAENKERENRVKDTWLISPCTLCEREDWVGDRYTCLYCPNMVLCSQCFYTGYHPDHPTLVTRDNKQFSRKVLSLSRVVAATVPWEAALPKPVYKLEARNASKP